MKNRYTKTTKSITDFYTSVVSNFYNHLDDPIYKDDVDNVYFQPANLHLDIPKNQLKDSKWMTITEEVLNRPDKIAYAAYGDERMAWILLQHNNITNPFDMELGQIIEIPSTTEISKAIKIKRDRLKI